MKKTLAILLSLVLLLTCSNAFALGYTGRQGNEATFETLEEARVNSVAAVQNLETNTTKVFASTPALDGYPEGTTFVYRSANLYGGRASARQNTNLVVFAEKKFETKDDAFAYLTELGLIAIADEAIGSVVLVTPANGRAFAQADQQNYYKLQTAMFSQKATSVIDGVSTSWSDAEYFGGYSFFYVIGIDGGATFLNNYIVGVLDYVSRIGGLLLINGAMERISTVAGCVPAFLVNASEATIAKYVAANEATAVFVHGDEETIYNQIFPVRKVVTLATDDVDVPALIKNAYYNLFVKAQRSETTRNGLVPTSASTPYQGYAQDCAPYSLEPRNALINGRTVDGINLIEYHEDWFNAVQTEDGEYLETWFEYLPDEVLDGTAAAGSIPLIVLQHGGGDDPRLYVEEQGYLKLMGERRIAAVAPEHQYITNVVADATTLLVKYMLEKYPALDASRVYVTGYSMGGWATYDSLYGDPTLYAAAAPQAITSRGLTEEQAARFEGIDVPIMCCTSEYDYFVDGRTHNLGMSYLAQMNQFLGYNELPLLKAEEQDYATYPIFGFKADRYDKVLLNGEYWNHTWYFEKDGVPLSAVNYTENNTHALYAEYANVVWNFLKHYSRDQETLEIIYDPYIY